ncbi:MAG TPA: hypothetical protein VMV84_06355, partial [Dehalococcoidales bacterium]|nr:hypothetical protein [Dehalococcoidales bacterium]
IVNLMTWREATTPVGIVTNATAEGEKVEITNLGELSVHDIDTEAILIIGNSETFVYDGKMVTPRVYKKGVGY